LRGRDGRRDRDVRAMGIETIRLTNAAVLGARDASEIADRILDDLNAAQRRLLGWPSVGEPGT